MGFSTGSAKGAGIYLVTGAAGFIGSRFIASCEKRGIPAVAVDKKTHFAERTEHSGVHYTNIVDRDELADWLSALQPDSNGRPPIGAIIHLGACANTMETNEAYLDRVNVQYSRFLWEYATRHQIPFVYASSAATYGDGTFGYDDDQSQISFLQPLNPYGRSKQIFDLWALEQEKAGKTPPAWAGFKFFNVYGFGERHKGPMASVVLHAHEQIKKEGQVQLFKSHRDGIADGHQKRDFIHVDDVIDVLHFAVQKPIARGIYNLGTGRARTFLDLVRAVFRSLNLPERIVFIDTPVAIRDRYQYFTEARMERLRLQGYSKEFLSLEEGVDRYLRELLGNSP
jgi:ADP-L-glycero-D-manno-heptose 6-epimerase